MSRQTSSQDGGGSDGATGRHYDYHPGDFGSRDSPRDHFFRHPRDPFGALTTQDFFDGDDDFGGGWPPRRDRFFDPGWGFHEPPMGHQSVHRPRGFADHFGGGFQPPMAARTEPESEGGASIPIRVIHERPNSSHKHQQRNTTELPPAAARQQADAATAGSNSPRLERAQSEPPKGFQHKFFDNIYSPIPEATAASATATPGPSRLDIPSNNLSTSASSPSVPSSGPPPSTSQDAPHSENQKTSASGVRHIPIFVEGRDDVDKNTSFKTPSQFYPQGVKKQSRGGLEPSAHGGKQPPLEPTSPISPPPGPIPMGYSVSHLNVPEMAKQLQQQQHQEPQQEQPQQNKEEPSASDEQPSGPIPLACSPDLIKKDDSDDTVGAEDHKKLARGNEKMDVEESVDPEQKRTLEELEKVKAEVASLVAKIDCFEGDKKSKEYLYLDEMLTRQLLSLDGVETHGKENIRQMRKEAIKTINRCLSMLDSKAREQEAEENNAILDDLAAKSAK